MLFRLIIAILSVVALSGCVNRMDAQLFPDQDLRKVNSLYVIKHDADEREINKLIARKFEQIGKTVATGNSETIPQDVDAVVTYIDKWAWDMTMYMLELTIIIENRDDRFPIAKGYSIHSSLTRKSPEKMVDEVITNIYKKQSQ